MKKNNSPHETSEKYMAQIPNSIVTIDVEPDNVWGNTHSGSFENIKQLPYFHRLCVEFGVRPTYLVSWSVANDTASAKIIEKLFAGGECEIGIHPHLWETPPFIGIDASSKGNVGLDYDVNILEDKISNLVELIRSRFMDPVSHRAGRWGIDLRQIKILRDLGIRVDSSVIPGVDWSSTGILDHSAAPLSPYYVSNTDMFDIGGSGVLEVPCTLKPGVEIFGLEKNRYIGGLLRRANLGVKWLRASPDCSSKVLKETSSWAIRQSLPLNLMSHSSEFLPGGSPYWNSAEDVTRHFNLYRTLFSFWRDLGVKSLTLSEFSSTYRSMMEKEFNG
jgi:hypothetical protein